MESASVSVRRQVVLAAAGPALAGAVLGLRSGPRAMALMAVALPAIVFGVTALTTPALYAGSAVLGHHSSMRAVATAMGRGLLALGVALLGLAPLALLLAATVTTVAGAAGRVAALVAVGALVALRRLTTELPLDERRGRATALLATWALVWAVIAVRLFCQAVEGGKVGL
jgi:hypothetical protein